MRCYLINLARYLFPGAAIVEGIASEEGIEYALGLMTFLLTGHEMGLSFPFLLEALSVAIRAATARNGVGLFTNLLRRLYANSAF